MKLNDKQHLFHRLWSEFYIEADNWLERLYGYVTHQGDPVRKVLPIIGIGYVPTQLKRAYIERIGGHPRSLHYAKLANHLLLIERSVHGETLHARFIYDTEAYAPLGIMWKQKHKDACWGGDFGSSDSTHFSFKHQGMM